MSVLECDYLYDGTSLHCKNYIYVNTGVIMKVQNGLSLFGYMDPHIAYTEGKIWIAVLRHFGE